MSNSDSLVITVVIQEHISGNTFEPLALLLLILFKDQINLGSRSFKLREKQDEALGGLLWHEVTGYHTAGGQALGG